MVALQNLSTLERSMEAWKFIRDGYRAIRGKAPKYSRSAMEACPVGATIPGISPAHVKIVGRPELTLDDYSVSEIEWSLLAEMVKESAQYSGPIVEVGVLAGRTTQRLAIHKAPEQKIIAVDNFCWNGWGLTPDEQWGLVKHSLAYLVDSGHVEIRKMDKNKFYQEYQGPSPSLVFLDAMHDYEETKKDILWAKKIGAKIVCGHDYKEEFPGVIKIVNEHGGPRLLKGSVFVL